MPIERRPWFDAFVSRFQQFAGQTLDEPRLGLGESMRDLICELPATLTVRERLATRIVVGMVLIRAAHLAALAQSADFDRACLLWMGSDLAAESWRADLQELVNRCATVLDTTPWQDRRASPGDFRVVRLLRIVEERYRDPHLKMAGIAKEVGLSICQAARLLKLQTGVGFCAHLQRVRIAEALRLLQNTTLTLKEISALVGFAYPSQLSRHFRQQHGMTPVSFRAQLATAI